jgi:hypothetical protein
MIIIIIRKSQPINSNSEGYRGGIFVHVELHVCEYLSFAFASSCLTSWKIERFSVNIFYIEELNEDNADVHCAERYFSIDGFFLSGNESICKKSIYLNWSP